MDVIQERLEREFNIDLIMTAPSVIYKVNMTDGASLMCLIRAVPSQPRLSQSRSLMLKLKSWCQQEFVGAVMELAQRKRGDFVTMDYIDENRVNVILSNPAC